jgi:hypothetical protein
MSNTMLRVETELQHVSLRRFESRVVLFNDSLAVTLHR